MSEQTTKPLLRTFSGALGANIILSYCSVATGSCIKPCSTYLEVNGFGLMRSAANFSWFLCLFELLSNFEAVNLNLQSLFHCSDDEQSLVASSILFILVSQLQGNYEMLFQNHSRFDKIIAWIQRKPGISKFSIWADIFPCHWWNALSSHKDHLSMGQLIAAKWTSLTSNLISNNC